MERPIDARQQQFFEQLVKDCDVEDICWLLNLKERISIGLYMYEPQSASCRRPRPEDMVPWPVAYILTRFHKENISWPLHRLPSMQIVGKAITSWSHRLKWRQQFFRDGPSMRGAKFRSTGTIKPFEGESDPLLHAYISAMRRSIWDACKRARSRWSRNPKAASNMHSLHRTGLALLAKCSHQAVPTDKMAVSFSSRGKRSKLKCLGPWSRNGTMNEDRPSRASCRALWIVILVRLSTSTVLKKENEEDRSLFL